MPHIRILLLGIGLLGGCTGPRPADSGGATNPSTHAAVEAATAAFHQALRTNDATALFVYVDDDVVMMPPGETAVRGKAAMRAWYAAFLTQFSTSSLTLGEREVFVGEGWAVETGTYKWELKPAAGGDAVVDRGHYMQVWKQQADGEWRFAREIWNSAAPAAAPPTKSGAESAGKPPAG